MHFLIITFITAEEKRYYKLVLSFIGYALLRVPEHINLALQAKRIYSGSLWQNYCQMHPNPNPTFQKNVKKDGYF